MTSVTDTYGKGLQFTYINNPSQYDDGQLWRVGDHTASNLSGSSPIGRYVELGYIQERLNGATTATANPLLATVRDVRGNSWTYNYYGQSAGENDIRLKNYLTEHRSPNFDSVGSGHISKSIRRQKLHYAMNATALAGITQTRGDGAIQIDWGFRPGGQNVTTETTANKTTIHRFSGNVLLGTQNPAGQFAWQDYSAQFRPAVQTDANGQQTSLAWGADGKQLQSVTDALGNSTAFSYNTGGASDGTLAASVDAQGRTTRYTYDDAANPRLPTRIQVYDANALTVLLWREFTYDTAGRTLTEKTFDPVSNGSVLLQEVDRSYYTSGNGNGMLMQVTQRDLLNPANDMTTMYFYDSVGRVIRTKQSMTFGSCTSSFTLYDDAGNVIASICNYDPGMNEDITTLAQALRLYDPQQPDMNRVTSYIYDALGRRVAVTTNAGAPFAQTTLTVYDALDRVVRTITNYVPNPAIPDPYVHARADFDHGTNNDQNLISETVYNERGLVQRQIDVLGNVTLFGYDDADRLIKTVQSASQPAYENSYNGDPSLARYAANDAPDQDIVTLNEYDPAGNLIKTTDALGNVTLTGYDALNRPVRTIRSASQPHYDVAADPTLSGYVASSAADQDLIDYTEYDVMGRVRRSQDTTGTWTLFGYDALGRQVKTIRCASQPTYDQVNDPSLSQYPASAEVDQDLITETAYDPAGQVMYTTDVLGRHTWTAYDGLRRAVKTVTNAVGTATDGGVHDPRSEFYHPVINFSDQDVITRTAYDSNGYVLWTQDVLGRRTWTAYDGVGRAVKTISNAVGMDTDDGGRDPRSDHYIPSANSDQDISTQTVYDAQGRVAATVDALGNRTQFRYDALGRRVQTVVNFSTGAFNPALPDRDLVSTTVYDIGGRVISTTDPRGTSTMFTYDRIGRRLTVTQAAGTSLATTSYTCYNKGGRVLRTIQNWKPKRTDAPPDARDERGNWRFNPFAHGMFNDQNLITVYTLDRLGRQTAVTNPAGNTSATTYGKDGQVSATTDPLGVVTAHRYDRARRRTLVVASYQAESFTDPAAWSWNDGADEWRDGNGAAITFGLYDDQNVIVQVEYDKAGRMLALRNPLGKRTTYAYDRLDRRVGRTDPLGNTWATTYTRLNGGVMRTSLTDPMGYVTQRDTDRLGRLASVKYLSESPKLTPDVSFSYDKGGSRLSMSESDGTSAVRNTVYDYDAARRLTSVGVDADGNGVVDETVSYAYDAGGRRTRLTLPGNLSVVYRYDARGQLIGMTDWDGQATSFAYDAAGRHINTERANGLRSRYERDAAGRLTRLRHSTPGKTLAQFDYTVDARGNRTQTRETVAHPATSSDVTISYNDKGIVTMGTWSNVSSFKQTTAVRAGLLIGFFGDAATLTMGRGADHGLYDVYIDGSLWQTFDGYAASAGQTDIEVTLGVNSRKLTHEGLHVLEIRNRGEHQSASSGNKVRFKQMVIVDKAYDLHTISYTYDALSRVIEARYAPGVNVDALDADLLYRYQYAFDVAGNRTQQIVTLAGSPTTTNYSYNAANQLTSDGTHTLTYDANGNLTSDGVNSYMWDRANRLLSMGGSSYTYDGVGNRVQQTVGTDVTKYLLDVQPGLAVVLSAMTGTDVTRNVHSPMGIHAQKNAAGEWQWMVNDGLGSVRGVVTDDLTTLESRLLDPYGNEISVTGTHQTVYHFTGEPRDGNGLQYHRARYYNPALGVFPSLDPFEGIEDSPMSLNGYSWVEGNLPNNIDPSGMLFWSFPPGYGSRSSTLYDPSQYILGGQHYAHAWIERWLEEENGFWRTHLEFPGRGRRIDAIVFEREASFMDPSPVYFVSSTQGNVFEIEPATTSAIVAGFIEVTLKTGFLRAGHNNPYCLFPNCALPSRDHWNPARPMIWGANPYVNSYGGAPYNWSSVQWQLGSSMGIGVINNGRGPVRVDPNMLGATVIPEAYWILLPVPGLIIYETESRLRNLGIVLVSSAVGKYLMDKYNTAQQGNSALPPAIPLPGYAAPTLGGGLDTQTIVVGGLILAGLCVAALTPIPDELILFGLLAGS